MKRTCNSEKVQVPRPDLECLICLTSIPRLNKSNGQNKLNERNELNPSKRSVKSGQSRKMLSSLFDLLCGYMKWSPPPTRYKFDFQNDPFPFCQDCKSGLLKLNRYHQMSLEVRTRIDQVVWDMCGKILLSHKDGKLLTGNVGISSGLKAGDEIDELGGAQHSSAGFNENYEKVAYYRDLVCKRYLASVRLTVDPGLYCDVKISEETMKERLKRLGNAEGDVEREDIQGTKSGGDARGTEIGTEGYRIDGRRRRKLKVKNQFGEERPKEVENEASADSGDEVQELDDDYVPGVPSDYEDVSEDEEIQAGKMMDSRKLCSGDDKITKAADEKSFEPVSSVEGGKNLWDPSLKAEVGGNTEDDIFSKTKIITNNPFPTLGSRVKSIGDNRFLLDDNCMFAFVNNDWKCISCEIVFQEEHGKMRLKQHLRVCPGGPSADVEETFKFRKFIYDKLKSGEFRCRHCKLLASSGKDVKGHMKSCPMVKPAHLKNLSCIEVELNKYLCEDKYPFEFSDKRFRCGTCPATYLKQSRVLGHIRAEHMKMKWKPKVSITNPSPGKFVVEGKFSFEKVNDDYVCCECNYSNNKWRMIQRHVVERHIEGERYSCETCGKTFSRKPPLRLHETIHLTDRSIICEMCGKAFKSQHLLRMHKDRKHLDTSDKNFSCEVCGKCFRTRSVLNKHMLMHELVVCDICGKQVPKMTLKSHLIIHNEDCTYECTKCDKKFRHPNSLRFHLKSHEEDVQRYPCDICGMTFTQKVSVGRHKKVIHNPDKSCKSNGKSRKRKREESSSEEVEDPDLDKTELLDREMTDAPDSYLYSRRIDVPEVLANTQT